MCSLNYSRNTKVDSREYKSHLCSGNTWNYLARGEISHEGQLVNKILHMLFTIRLKYRGKIYTDIMNKSEASTRNLSARLSVQASVI